nr:ribonuclease H-like domain, reverse transcriptase, RNA-dependent DNA polymerase [Tanacetum cinerariifolium]
MTLAFVDTHNMIAYLTKSDASERFNQIIDFLNGSSIKYALTVNLNIYVSCIKLFWTCVTVKKVNDVTRLQALVDKKKVVITEATIRDALRLDVAEGVECLPNEEIFAELARMGYEKPSTKLTFYKAFFSSQWKFFIHTILQCMSAKRMSLNEFSFSMASAVIFLSTCRKFTFSKYIFDSLVRNVDSSTKFYMYPRFLQLMIRAQVGDLSSHTIKYSSPTLTQKVFTSMRRVGKGFSRVETPLFEGMIVEPQVGKGVDEVHVDDVPAVGVAAEGAASVVDDEVTTDDVVISMDLQNLLDTYTTLTRRVEHLEQDKISQALEIKKAQTEVMDDVSKHGRMIADMDAYDDVTLKDVVAVAKDVQDAKIKESSDVQGRKAESQAQMYQINLEHADKVLSMQDVDIEPAELQEVVEVITFAKLITEVVTTASATITVATPQLTTDAAPTLTTALIATRRRKGVKEDNAVKRYQALKRKPQTEAQSMKNMMIYLRNMAGFKMDYFKGMTYDDIRPIFEKKFNSNVAFLLKTKEQMDEKDSRALKRLSESQEDKASKKQKLDEEVKELRRHLQIVPNDEDDVYTEATPLALKVPVVDYEIYTENNKPYYKIKRADGSHQLYLSFLSMLRNFDREDLEVLWQLVKERFASTKPKNFFSDFLLTTLGAMFEKPDVEAQIWKNQRSVHGQAKESKDPHKACHRITGACFSCGLTGHMAKDSPKNDGSGSKGNRNDKQLVAKGKVFSLTRDQAANSSDTISGTLLMNDRAVFVLFDTGATHSVISITLV